MGKQETISSKKAPRLCQGWQFTLTIWLKSLDWWQSEHMLWKASDIEFTCRLNLLVLLHTTSSFLNPNHNSMYKCRLDPSAQNQPWLEAREFPKTPGSPFQLCHPIIVGLQWLSTSSLVPRNPHSYHVLQDSAKAVLPPGNPLFELVLSSVSVLCPGHASMLMLVPRADSSYLLI